MSLITKLLTVGGDTYLMMGNQSGNVTTLSPTSDLALNNTAFNTAFNTMNASNDASIANVYDFQQPENLTVTPKQNGTSVASTLNRIQTQNTSRTTHQNGRTIHIGSITIQTSDLDADKFMDELEMIAR